MSLLPKNLTPPPEIIITPLKFLNPPPPKKKFSTLPPPKISHPPLPKFSQLPPSENFSIPRKFLNPPPPPKISQTPRKFLNPPPPRKFLTPPPENFSTPHPPKIFFAFQFFRGGGPAQKIAEKMIFSTKKVTKYRKNSLKFALMTFFCFSFSRGGIQAPWATPPWTRARPCLPPNWVQIS